MNNNEQRLTELTYDLAVTDCWCYLYHELGMKDLAEGMLEFITKKRGGEENG